MSNHIPTFSHDDDHKLPNEHFFQWIKSNSNLFITQVLGVLGFISFLAGLIYYLSNGEYRDYFEPKKIQEFSYYAHIIFITIFIILLINILDKNKNGSYRVGLVYRKIFNDSLSKTKLNSILRTSKIQLRKFKLNFLFFWISMLILYIAFALKLNFQGKVDAIIKPEITITNNALEAFLELKFEFLTFALNNISLLFIFWCFLILYLPAHVKESKKKQNLLRNYSSLIIFLITVSFPLLITSVQTNKGFIKNNLTAYTIAFDAISGTLNALALALLIARLDSKLIGLPSWLISVLYLYSAVQPLFIAFEQPGVVFEIIKTSVLIIVFLFKIYFYFILIYTMQTGRMLNYLFCFPTLNSHVDTVFANQFEIETLRDHREFSFQINKKFHKLYSTELYFHNKIDCRNSIEQLIELASHSNNYKVGYSSGTYWVDIIDKDNEVICNSISLKSEEEVDDLIHETMENLPKCKVDFG
jgi:hypothetical protein